MAQYDKLRVWVWPHFNKSALDDFITTLNHEAEPFAQVTPNQYTINGHCMGINEPSNPYVAPGVPFGPNNEVVVNRRKRLFIWCGITALQAVLHAAVFLSWNPLAILGRDYRGTVMCIIPLLASVLIVMFVRRIGVLMAIGGCIVSFLFGLVHWLAIMLIVAQAI